MPLIQNKSTVSTRGSRAAWHYRTWLLLALFICGVSVVQAAWQTNLPNPEWRSVNPLPSGNDIQSVIRANTQFVAVGNGGLIMTSPDGNTWNIEDSATIQRIYDVTWVNTPIGMRYVAVGEGGLIMTSPDAVNWTLQAQPYTRWKLFSVAGNGTILVAVGEVGTVLTSNDGGVTWTERDPGTGSGLRGVIWNTTHAAFIAVGSSETIITSPDGINWTIQMSSPPDTNNPAGGVALRDIAANGANLVAVGYDGTIITSPDGMNWTVRTAGTSSGTATTKNIETVAWTGTEFIAAGDAVLLTSTGAGINDGSTWTDAIDPAGGALIRTIAYGAGQYLIAGREALGTAAGSPGSAGSWSAVTSGTTVALADMASDGTLTASASLWVAVGAGGAVVRSTDGRNWSTVAPASVPTTADLMAITFGNSLYVAVGASGTIIVSSDGSAWSAVSPAPTSNDLKDVIWDGSQFVAVGAAGTILTGDATGMTWTAQSCSGCAINFDGIAYNGGTLHIAVGDNGATGEIWSSDDNAATWSATTATIVYKDYNTPGYPEAPTPPALRAIAWSGSLFVAVGDNGAALYSSKGTGTDALWSTGYTGTSATLRRVAVNGLASGSGRQVLVVGDQTPPNSTTFAPALITILSSVDGSTWRSQNAVASGHLAGVAWDGTEFRAVGAAGTILQSGGVDIGIEVLKVPGDLVRVNEPYTYAFAVINIANLNSGPVMFTHTVPSNLNVSLASKVVGIPSVFCGTFVYPSMSCQVIGMGAGSPATSIFIYADAIGEGGITLEATATHNASAVPPIQLGDVNSGNDTISYTDTISPAIPIPPPKKVDSGALDAWLLAALLPAVWVRIIRRAQGARGPRKLSFLGR